MTAPNQTPNKQPRSNKTKFGIFVGATALLIGASFGVNAVADTKTYQHAKLYITSANASEGDTRAQKVSWGKRDRKGFSQMTDEQIEKRVTRMVKHVSIEIEATPEQEQKITALVTAVAKDMRPLRNEFRAAGEEMQKLLTADKVDRAAMESIRAERIAEADRVSKELMNMAADVAEVLNAEQRQILKERIQQFKSKRRRWHRG